jgi:hypothetical protein
MFVLVFKICKSPGCRNIHVDSDSTDFRRSSMMRSRTAIPKLIQYANISPTRSYIIPARKAFREEYIKFLETFMISYDERFLFDRVE